LEKVGVFQRLKDYNSRPEKLNRYIFKIAKNRFSFYEQVHSLQLTDSEINKFKMLPTFSFWGKS